MTPPVNIYQRSRNLWDTSTAPLHDPLKGVSPASDSWGQSYYTTAPANPIWEVSSILNSGFPSLWFPMPRVAAAPPNTPPKSKQDWMDLLLHVTGNINSLDLDIYRVPINRGLSLCRYPEFTPVKKRPEGCTIKIQPNTTARVHGEIRPIQGKNESWITRVGVDFHPNVVNILPNLPDLEIDGFAAIDPPKIDFKKTKQKIQWEVKNPVTTMKGGDLDYENYMLSGKAIRTPFGVARPAPQGGHNYWMFHFNPIRDTAMAALQDKISNRQAENSNGKLGLGAMHLWAFLPTMGLTDPKVYQDLGIPYNTFPRKFDDLLKMFMPLFDPVKGKKLRNNAPYLNPNTEYADENGIRHPIPEDVNEIHKINARFKRLNQTRKEKIPLIEKRNSGVIVDWIFNDLVNDLPRFRGIAAKDLPKITAHIRLNQTRLQLPVGEIQITPNTDLKLTYYLERVKHPQTGKIHPRLGVQVELNPVEFQDISFQVGGYSFQAKELKAKKVLVKIPSIPGIIKNDPLPREPWSLHLEGIEAKGLKIGDELGNFANEAKVAKFKSVDFTGKPKGWDLKMGGLEGKDLRLRLPMGDLKIDEAKVPGDITAAQTYVKKGVPKELKVHVTGIESKGSFSIAKPGEFPMELKMSGSSKLENIHFHRKWAGQQNTMKASLDFAGTIPKAELTTDKLGTATFTTIDEKKGGGQNNYISGDFTAVATLPNVPGQPALSSDYKVNVKMPYVGMETKGRFKIPHGSARLRDASLTLAPKSVAFEGDVKLKDGSMSGFGDGPTHLGQLLFAKDSPQFKDIQVEGRVAFESTDQGWSLKKSAKASGQVQIHFDLADTLMQHAPDLTGTPLGKLPASKIIQSNVELKSARVRIEDLQEVAYQKFTNGTDEPKGKLTAWKSGAISVDHLKGEGTLWMNLVVWGYVRGLFPSLGGSSGSWPKSKKTPARPDVAILTKHLPSEVQKQLGTGDFFRLGKVNYQVQDNGDWESQVEDLLLNIHSDGITSGKKQGDRAMFAMVRVPKFKVGRKDGKPLAGLGLGGYWVNIFVHSPDKGGFFRFVRWPEKPKNK